MDNRAAEYPMSPKEATKFVLTAGQSDALIAISTAILEERENYKALLEGWAGTGKTFTINRIVEFVRAHNPEIHFGMTAPTHKAVRQLRKHSEMKDQLDFGTIHSFLGLKEVQKKDPKDPDKEIISYELDWTSQKERKIDSIDVLIVDEASMLNDTLYGYIDDMCRSRPDLRVIFMGDSLQIPPVGKKEETGQSDAIPFVAEQRQSRKIEHYVLSEIVRQKEENLIISYSAFIRQNVKRPKITWLPPELATTTMDPLSSGVEVIYKERGIVPLLSLFRQYFDTPSFEKDTDYIKVVAWRKATVAYFNHEIRKILNKTDVLPKILVGERLVLDKPVVKGDRIILPNNEEIDVARVELQDYELTYKFISPNSFESVSTNSPRETRKTEKMKVYNCVVKTLEGKEYPIIILHEDYEKRYHEIRELLASTAKKLSRQGEVFEGKDMWREFFSMEKKFAWVVYNYCLTAHKAQGSTYDYCISMEWDIDQNWDTEERNRIRYVAATRARNKLFVVR